MVSFQITHLSNAITLTLHGVIYLGPINLINSVRLDTA